MCHAYEFVRCRPGEACQGEDMHDDHFGTKISVVDRRARQLLGLFAMGDGESHAQHHFFPEGDKWIYMPNLARHNVREHPGSFAKGSCRGRDSDRNPISGQRHRQASGWEGLYVTSKAIAARYKERVGNTP